MTPPPTLETMLISRLSPGAVQISYNKPKIANAFSPQTYDELRQALLWAQQEPDVNVVLV
jgi:peroxisomal 3,2-trans-enoyl-CoA isomerase